MRVATTLIDAIAIENEYQGYQFVDSLTRSTKKEIKQDNSIKYWESVKVLFSDQDYHYPNFNVLTDLVSRLGLPTNINIVT